MAGHFYKSLGDLENAARAYRRAAKEFPNYKQANSVASFFELHPELIEDGMTFNTRNKRAQANWNKALEKKRLLRKSGKR